MEIYKNLPIDLVNRVLAYDNLFVIRNGIPYNRLNKEKYEKICISLLSKQKKSITYNADTKHFWAWVEFDKYMIKYYNDEVDIDYIRYEFRRKVGSGKNIRYLVHDRIRIQ